MKKLTFENKTHWRSSDIERIVRMALVAGGADLSEERHVLVVHPKRLKTVKGAKRQRPNGMTINPSVATVTYAKTVVGQPALLGADREVFSLIILRLPRQGSRKPHPNIMVAMAASAAVATHVDSDTTLLPFSDVYTIVNNMAYSAAVETAVNYDYDVATEYEEARQRVADLHAFFNTPTPPNWGDGSKLFIAKYKDPLKDATYKAFVAKKVTALKREETRISTLKNKIVGLKKQLKDAEGRKKKAEKALQAARERRT